MFCSSCGQALTDQAVVCTGCGCPTPNFTRAPAAPEHPVDGQILASYLAGAFIPLFGWIMAVYWLVKGRVGHALGVGTLSLFMFFFWVGVLANMK